MSNATQTVMDFGRQLEERIQQLIAIKRTLVEMDSGLKGVALDRAAATVQAIADTYEKV